MDVSLSSWLVILLAVFAANLPFLNERLFGLAPIAVFRKMYDAIISHLPRPQLHKERVRGLESSSALSSESQPDQEIKLLWLRLVEMFVLYLLVGGIAYLLEARIGNVFKQGWEFYAVTGCLFTVFAFPGFVFRYLRKRHG